MAEAKAASAASAGFSDGTWSFSLTKDGIITVVGGPSNVGAKYLPGSAAYNTVVWNLSKLPGNKQRMLAVCPGMQIRAPAAPPLPVQSFVPEQSQSTAMVLASDVLPPPDQGGAIWQRKWFWPAVISLGAVATIGGFILFWPKNEEG